MCVSYMDNVCVSLPFIPPSPFPLLDLPRVLRVGLFRVRGLG